MPKHSQKRDHDGVFARPDSAFWWISFVNRSGQTTRRSSGIRRSEDPRKDKARLVRAQWIMNEPHQPAKEDVVGGAPLSFDKLLLAYLDGPSLLKRSARRDRTSAKQLFPFFTGFLIAELKGADIRQYIGHRMTAGPSTASVNRELALLQTAINWARKEWDLDLPNPVQGRKLPEPPPRTRWLTHEEADQFLAASEGIPRAEHLPDFIRLGLNTGLRSGEMLKLNWNRVDLNQRLIYLGAADQKNKRMGSVPLNRSAIQALENRRRFCELHCNDSPWVFCDRRGARIGDVKKSFATAARRANLYNVRPHDLRRTFGSWLTQLGTPIQWVSALLRHSDIRVTDKVYAHLSPTTLRDTVDRLERYF